MKKNTKYKYNKNLIKTLVNVICIKAFFNPTRSYKWEK